MEYKSFKNSPRVPAYRGTFLNTPEGEAEFQLFKTFYKNPKTRICRHWRGPRYGFRDTRREDAHSFDVYEQKKSLTPRQQEIAHKAFMQKINQEQFERCFAPLK